MDSNFKSSWAQDHTMQGFWAMLTVRVMVRLEEFAQNGDLPVVLHAPVSEVRLLYLSTAAFQHQFQARQPPAHAGVQR